MTITIDELRNLLGSATPDPWVWREDEWGSHNLVHWVEGETFASGAPRYIEVHCDGSAGGEYGPSIDVDGPEAALIALAPTLARRVIAAEKLVEALRQAELTTEELCRGQSTENQCWVILGEIRAALAEYEAATNAQ